jgi:hypothetical protein
LRFDEVLKIQSHDIRVLDGDRLEVFLPFRKTNQFGGLRKFFRVILCLTCVSFPEIPPFVLHAMPQEMAHLCPVHAYADWLTVSEINEGYIFRKMASGDRISQANEPMVGIFHLLR